MDRTYFLILDDYVNILIRRFIDYEGPNVPKQDFFSPAMRSRMVHEILLRTRYGEEQQQFGKFI